MASDIFSFQGTPVPTIGKISEDIFSRDQIGICRAQVSPLIEASRHWSKTGIKKKNKLTEKKKSKQPKKGNKDSGKKNRSNSLIKLYFQG